jgi:hypothetical protein
MIHQPALSSYLTVAELVLSSFKGIITRPELQSDRRALKAKRIDKTMLKIAFIGRWN